MKLKRKIFLLIPIAIITGHIIYTWFVILFVNHWATWRHFVGLALFIALIYVLIRSFVQAAVATGIYLVTGAFNLLTITPDVLLAWGFRIGPLEVSLPIFQPRLFLILFIYIVLNFDTLVDIRLDYKEAKELRQER